MPNSNTKSSESITNFILNRLSIILTGVLITLSVQAQQICHDIYPRSQKLSPRPNNFLTSVENQLAQDLKYGNIAEAVQLISVTGERAKQFTLSIGKALTESNESSINNFDKVINTEAQLVEGAKLVDQLGKLLNSPKKGFLLRSVTKFDDQVVESLKKIIAHRKMANDFEIELKQRSIEIDQIHEKLLAVRQQLGESIVQFKKWQHVLDLALRDNRLSSEQLKEVSRIRSIYMTSLETLNHQKQFTEDSIKHNQEAKERILKSAEKNSYFLRNTIAEFIKTYRLDLLEIASRSKKQMVEIALQTSGNHDYYEIDTDFHFYQRENSYHVDKVEYVKKYGDNQFYLLDGQKNKILYSSIALVVREEFGNHIMKNIAIGDLAFDTHWDRPFFEGIVAAKLNLEHSYLVRYPNPPYYSSPHSSKYWSFYRLVLTNKEHPKSNLLKVSEALNLFSHPSNISDTNVISISSKLKNSAKAFTECKIFLTNLLNIHPDGYLRLMNYLIQKSKIVYLPIKSPTADQESTYLPIKEMGFLLEAIDTIESHRSDLNLQNLDHYNLNPDLRETVEIVLKLKKFIANEQEKDLQEREDNNDIFHLLK